MFLFAVCVVSQGSPEKQKQQTTELASSLSLSLSLQPALSPSCEDTASRQDSLTRNSTGGHLDFGLPAFRTVRNKFLSFKPPSLWYFLLQ